VRTLAAVAQW